jgi:transcriptional regulator with XRE-family HTH domain
VTFQAWAEREGLSQAQLAALLDVDQTSISKWFSGDRTPGIDSIIRIELLTRGEVPYFVWSTLISLEAA